jgi:hypothetical protein
MVVSRELCARTALSLQRSLQYPLAGTCLDVVAKKKNFHLLKIELQYLSLKKRLLAFLVDWSGYGKGQVVPVYAMKASIAPRILNLSTRWR